MDQAWSGCAWVRVSLNDLRAVVCGSVTVRVGLSGLRSACRVSQVLPSFATS